MESKDIVKNDVPSSNQTLKKIDYDLQDNPKLKVLFVGNSITLHSPKPEIGWYGDWGMSASCRENDYVHVVLKALRKKYGAVSACIACAAEWERNYWDEEVLDRCFREGRDFKADVVVFRIGENVHTLITEKYDFYKGFKMMADYFCSNENAQVFVTDMFWHSDIIDTPIKKFADEHNCTFIHIGDLGENDENKAIGLFDHAGVAIHPGDLGMKRIGERIANAIMEKVIL